MSVPSVQNQEAGHPSGSSKISTNMPGLARIHRLAQICCLSKVLGYQTCTWHVTCPPSGQSCGPLQVSLLQGRPEAAMLRLNPSSRASRFSIGCRVLTGSGAGCPHCFGLRGGFTSRGLAEFLG